MTSRSLEQRTVCSLEDRVTEELRFGCFASLSLFKINLQIFCSIPITARLFCKALLWFSFIGAINEFNTNYINNRIIIIIMVVYFQHFKAFITLMHWGGSGGI